MLPIKIEITSFGRVEREYREVISFYESRISSMARIKYRINFRGALADGTILLDEHGKMLDSEEFYRLIMNYTASGKIIRFAVGPPEGFSEEQKKGKYLISLSMLTMRHELAYLVLLEQIYRALLRFKGTTYHR